MHKKIGSTQNFKPGIGFERLLSDKDVEFIESNNDCIESLEPKDLQCIGELGGKIIQHTENQNLPENLSKTASQTQQLKSIKIDPNLISQNSRFNVDITELIKNRIKMQKQQQIIDEARPKLKKHNSLANTDDLLKFRERLKQASNNQLKQTKPIEIVSLNKNANAHHKYSKTNFDLSELSIVNNSLNIIADRKPQYIKYNTGVLERYNKHNFNSANLISKVNNKNDVNTSLLESKEKMNSTIDNPEQSKDQLFHTDYQENEITEYYDNNYVTERVSTIDIEFNEKQDKVYQETYRTINTQSNHINQTLHNNQHFIIQNNQAFNIQINPQIQHKPSKSLFPKNFNLDEELSQLQKQQQFSKNSKHTKQLSSIPLNTQLNKLNKNQKSTQSLINIQTNPNQNHNNPTNNHQNSQPFNSYSHYYTNNITNQNQLTPFIESLSKHLSSSNFHINSNPHSNHSTKQERFCYDFLGLRNNSVIQKLLEDNQEEVSSYEIYSEDVFLLESETKTRKILLITTNSISILRPKEKDFKVKQRYKLVNLEKITISEKNTNLIALHFGTEEDDLLLEILKRNELLFYFRDITCRLKQLSKFKFKVSENFKIKRNGVFCSVVVANDCNLFLASNFECANKVGYLSVFMSNFFKGKYFKEKLIVLSNIGLFVFDDPNKLPTDFIRIHGSEINRLEEKKYEKKFVFEVMMVNKETLIFAAKTLEEMNSWITELRNFQTEYDRKVKSGKA